MSEWKIGFEKVIQSDTKIMILGSFPGRDSLASRDIFNFECYYEDAGNSFWKLIGKAICENFTTFSNDHIVNYQTRRDALLKNKIGLWDFIGACDRDNSSDKKLKHARKELNDFYKLRKDYPNIEYVLINGKGLANWILEEKNRKPKVRKYQEMLNDAGFKNVKALQCSSGSNPRSLETKWDDWKIIKTLIG